MNFQKLGFEREFLDMTFLGKAGKKERKENKLNFTKTKGSKATVCEAGRGLEYERQGRDPEGIGKVMEFL